MWPFGKKKIVVTAEEFAMALWELRKKSKKQFLSELQQQAEQNWKLEADEITIMANEVLIADLWLLSNALKNDRHVLDVLHDKYFSVFVNSGKTQEEKKSLLSKSQSDLHERYNVYYKAWEIDMKPDHWMNLASEMARFFFPNQVNPGLNAFLTFVIHTRYSAFFVSIYKFRSDFQIVGL